MARSKWDNFKTTRHQEKKGGLFTLIAIVGFCAVIGAGMGLAFGIWLLPEVGHYSRADGDYSSLYLIYVIPMAIGAVAMAGTAAKFLWEFEKHQREDELRRRQPNDRGGTGGPIL